MRKRPLAEPLTASRCVIQAFRKKLRILLLMTFCSTPMVSYAEYSIGVYYFPGWRNNAFGAPAQYPWEKIRPYLERMPLLGYYSDDDPAVLSQQIRWMANYGIDYVVFDWYWNDQVGTYLSHALDTYFALADQNSPKVSLMWANHDRHPESKADFERMVHSWKNYFSHPNFLKIDGKPVVFVFSMEMLEERANRFGETAQSLLAMAQSIVQQADFAGVFFVGGTATTANNPIFSQLSRNTNTLHAISAYNYHGPATFRYSGGHTESHSFAELDQAYRDHWRWMINNTAWPYIVPMTSGWNSRPWGGSMDSLHDNSMSSPDQFELHLREAKKLMDASSARTLKTGIICCWNEYGEGSFIEPTQRYQFEFLKRVQKVFGEANLVNR